jgi:hypothetical protein
MWGVLVQSRCAGVNDCAGERGSESRSEKGCALGIEVKLVGLIILCGKSDGIYGDQSFNASFLRSEEELMDGIFRGRGGRKKNDEFGVVGVTEIAETFKAEIGVGIKQRCGREAGARFQESDEIFVVENDVAKNLRANDVASVPENAGMSKKEIAGRCVIEFQVGGGGEGVLGVKKHQWDVILADGVSKKTIDADTEDDELRTGALAEQTTQAVVPIIESGAFEENGMDVHAAGSELLQAIDIDAVKQK